MVSVGLRECWPVDPPVPEMTPESVEKTQEVYDQASASPAKLFRVSAGPFEDQPVRNREPLDRLIVL